MHDEQSNWFSNIQSTYFKWMSSRANKPLTIIITILLVLFIVSGIITATVITTLKMTSAPIMEEDVPLPVESALTPEDKLKQNGEYVLAPFSSLKGHEALEYMIVADKYDRVLHLLKNQHGFWGIIKSYPIAIGVNPGRKKHRGDKKTPEGLYFIIKRKEDIELNEIFGPLAFVLNYPNDDDKLESRTGNGIWIHGTVPGKVPVDTKGCLEMHNNNILKLAQYIKTGDLVPVIIHNRELFNLEKDIDLTQIWEKREVIVASRLPQDSIIQVAEIESTSVVDTLMILEDSISEKKVVHASVKKRVVEVTHVDSTNIEEIVDDEPTTEVVDVDTVILKNSEKYTTIRVEESSSEPVSPLEITKKEDVDTVVQAAVIDTVAEPTFEEPQVDVVETAKKTPAIEPQLMASSPAKPTFQMRDRSNTPEKAKVVTLRKIAETKKKITLVKKPAVKSVNDKELIKKRLTKWCQDWNSADIARYQSNYDVKKFKTGNYNWIKWRTKKERTFKNNSQIQIAISNVEIQKLNKKMAVVLLFQEYQSDLFKAENRKKITLQKRANNWKIVEELTVQNQESTL